MTFANVLLICTGAIAGCAALVFLVETLVAFCFHDEERSIGASAVSVPLESGVDDFPFDRAA